MPEAIRAAIARQKTVTPRDARHHAGVTQQQWADWFGLSISTVQRSEEDGDWDRYPDAARNAVALWLALFGPDPEDAFRAVGRWALFADIRNASDAIYVRATEGQPLLEAMNASAKARQHRDSQ